MEKLPEEFKEKWLAALRSGKYKQGKFALHNSDGYCCLGVACIVAGSKPPIKKAYQFINADEFSFNIDSFPEALCGTTGENGTIEVLTGMNDNGNASFKQIADWIEENL